MREYLNLEFHDIELTLPFDYNLERVIDDFILLAVFVGNSFLPNLPDLHLHKNGPEWLFDVYKRVLPSLGKFLRVSILSHPTNSYVLLIDEYLNESRTINMKRLQVVLDEMGHWEREIFEKEYADMNLYKGNRGNHVKEMERGRKWSKLGKYLLGSRERAQSM
jgi:5'-3' exoribonuclease 1